MSVDVWNGWPCRACITEHELTGTGAISLWNDAVQRRITDSAHCMTEMKLPHPASLFPCLCATQDRDGRVAAAKPLSRTARSHPDLRVAEAACAVLLESPLFLLGRSALRHHHRTDQQKQEEASWQQQQQQHPRNSTAAAPQQQQHRKRVGGRQRCRRRKALAKQDAELQQQVGLQGCVRCCCWRTG